jgi:hypothetical protein
VRLPVSSHTEAPWRIHELTGDFDVEDVWAFRTPGAGAGDFPVMLAAMRRGGDLEQQSRLAGLLLALRRRIGAILGWDRPSTGVGTRVTSLRDRLPADLRDAPAGAADERLPLTPVYELPTESARELANTTVHAVMHLGWAPASDGDYELRMAILVKPNGRFGKLYMAAIAPFRYLIVYPALTRTWEKAWRERPAA